MTEPSVDPAEIDYDVLQARRDQALAKGLEGWLIDYGTGTDTTMWTEETLTLKSLFALAKIIRGET